MIITAQGDGPNGKAHELCSFKIDLDQLVQSSLSNAARDHTLLLMQRQELDQLAGGSYTTKVYVDKAEVLDMFAFLFQDANFSDVISEISHRVDSIRRLKVVNEISAAALEQDQF